MMLEFLYMYGMFLFIWGTFKLVVIDQEATQITKLHKYFLLDLFKKQANRGLVNRKESHANVNGPGKRLSLRVKEGFKLL